MSALTRFLRKKRENPKPDGGKIYKMVNTCSIIGLFVAVGLIVLMAMKIIPWTSSMVGIIVAIGILCISIASALPWIRRIEINDSKILSYIFLGVTVLNCILWIICDIVLISEYKAIKNAFVATETLSGEELVKLVESVLRTINFLKALAIISILTTITNFIATTYVKYKKSMLALQVISAASCLILAFWLIGFLFTFSINSNISKLTNANNLDGITSQIFVVHKDWLKFLVSKAMLTVFFLTVAFVSVSRVVISKNDQRRMSNTIETLNEGAEKIVEEKSLEDKLSEIKNLLDKNLISQEEYEKKKEEILKDI